MEHILKIQELQKLLQSRKQHSVGKVTSIFPFVGKSQGSLSKNIGTNFNCILGETTRQICGLKIQPINKNDADLVKSDNPFIEQILNAVECNDTAKEDLKRFLEHYLFDKEKHINPIHPYIYNYIPIPLRTNKADKKKEITSYAQFINNVLAQNDPRIKSIFSNKDYEDILTELILNNLETLEQVTSTISYHPILNNISKLYQDDMVFLKKYKDYFLTAFPLLTHFYTFMYVIQLLLSLQQFEKADYNECYPVYFALDWESVTRRRAAVDYSKKIIALAPNLFVHIHTVAQLSYNTLNDEQINNKIIPLPYNTLLNQIEQEGVTEKFYQDIVEWMHLYSSFDWLKNKADIAEPKNISDAIRGLFTCIKKGMSESVFVEYGKNIENLGSNVFFKSRGNLGKILNINQETLHLLTAVSTKNKRIPLNQLFNEFNKRGIMFDRYTKKEIVDLLDSQNILDKKSDSGDAQYVKPIL